jgi:hypothetical protein
VAMPRKYFYVMDIPDYFSILETVNKDLHKKVKQIEAGHPSVLRVSKNEKI